MRIASKPEAQQIRIAILVFLVAVVLIANLLIYSTVFNQTQAENPIAPALQNGVIVPMYRLQDFGLQSTSGKRLWLSELRGQWTLLTFGSAQDINALSAILERFANIRRDLKLNAAQVQLVFISLDPRDTPDLLRARLGEDIIGMAYDADVIAQIQTDYGFTVSENGTVNDVSNDFYLADRISYLTEIIPADTDSRLIGEKMEAYLLSEDMCFNHIDLAGSEDE